MKPLGHASDGARRLALRAREAILKHGQAAIFLGCGTGEAVAVEHTDADYTGALQRHALHLVGVYRDDLSNPSTLGEQLVGGFLIHMREARLFMPQAPMRERLLLALERGPRPTNDLARELGVTPCYVRRLIAELRREGQVRPTGRTPGRNAHSIVWSLAA